MGLTIHGPRRLSQLEKDVVLMVFDGSSSFTSQKIRDAIRVQIVPEIVYANGEIGEGSQANGLIKISKSQHLFTDDLDHSNTRHNTDIFKPGNMYYLNTLLHEVTHWWQKDQDRYTNRVPTYTFDYNELCSLDFNCKEQHASAAATWFNLGWQLEYRDGDEHVDLTHAPRFKDEHVGKVDRYSEIGEIPTQSGSNNPPAGRHVTRAKARELSDDFNALLNELRTN